MTDPAQIFKKEFRHFVLAEKPGSFFLNNNITDHTSVYSKIEKCTKIITMRKLFREFKSFWFNPQTVDGIFPCKSKSIRMKCNHLTLRILLASGRLHNNLGKLMFQATDYILFI